jgi:hypothetical protein
LTLLSGSYEIDVWLDGAKAEHLALDLPSAEEVDLVRDGSEAWLWDSSTDTATHLVGEQGAQASPTTAPSTPAVPALTPQQLASRLLSHVSTSTSVTTGAPLYVAGQPAYQLVLAPKSAPGSTIDHVEIDVGSSGALLGVPLQVAVYARGQVAAALELGFTGVLHLGAPPAAELSFAPPPGAKVVTHTLTADGGGWFSGRPGGSGQVSDLHKTGTGWATVISGSSSELAGQAQQGLLSEGTTVVQFDGREGRLFSTELVNVLIMPDGQFFAGLVTPAVLEATASASTSTPAATTSFTSSSSSS